MVVPAGARRGIAGLRDFAGGRHPGRHGPAADDVGEAACQTGPVKLGPDHFAGGGIRAGAAAGREIGVIGDLHSDPVQVLRGIIIVPRAVGVAVGSPTHGGLHRQRGHWCCSGRR